MADDLRKRFEEFKAFADQVLRDLDRLSKEQQEILAKALRRVDLNEIAEIRKSLGLPERS